MSDGPQSHDLPVSRPRVSVKDMIEDLRDEAYQIEARQTAIVKAGMRTAPYPERMRKVASLDAAADVLEKVLPYWDDIVEMVNRRRYRGPRR